jgi:hypothetical protein
VLPSALSRGNYGYAYWPIARINGQKIVDFNDFYRKLTQSKQRLVILTNKMGEEILIDKELALKMQPSILRRYNIEYDRSPDLRRQPQASSTVQTHN